MEQQSTYATPSKRQDVYVQYTPQIVTNYNQQFDHQQQGLGSPSQEHYEDSMLELKDVDTLPSNYAFLSHQTPNNPNNQQQVYMIPQQPQQQTYLPAETQQRVYETPTNNNYINSGMNPNIVPHMTTSSSSEPSSFDMSKYTTWTRVVLIFAVCLGIYGCFGLVSQLLMAFSFTNMVNNDFNTAIPSMITGTILSIVEIAAGAVGVWSTITKNQKHRKNTIIAHLVLLSIVILVNIASGVFVNVQMMYSDTAREQITSTGVDPQHLKKILVLSILLYVLMIFACCGSCIGCQAYRFRIISNLQENTQPEATQGEGFMVMRDEV